MWFFTKVLNNLGVSTLDFDFFYHTVGKSCFLGSYGMTCYGDTATSKPNPPAARKSKPNQGKERETPYSRKAILAIPRRRKNHSWRHENLLWCDNFYQIPTATSNNRSQPIYLNLICIPRHNPHHPPHSRPAKELPLAQILISMYSTLCLHFWYFPLVLTIVELVVGCYCHQRNVSHPLTRDSTILYHNNKKTSINQKNRTQNIN